MVFLPTEDLYEEEIFLKLIRTSEENKEKGYVPAYYFAVCLRGSGKEIGSCDLRIGYNENTYYGGNIGYRIEEPYRGNHYAAKACRLLFKLARKHDMDSLIITCNPENRASAKTCEYAGGILKETAKLPVTNEMYREGAREKCIYFFPFDQDASESLPHGRCSSLTE